MHAAFDPARGVNIWIDDIGSVMHVVSGASVDGIARNMRDLRRLLGMNATLAILGEGISGPLLAELSEKMPDALLFAVSPAPAIQFSFKENFDDDAVVFTALELAYDVSAMQPIESCYVGSRHHGAYSCCLYGGNKNIEPQTALLEYVKGMSRLSWLSVKPASPQRSTAYPPHIAALLRSNNAEASLVTRFEFLSSLL
jgi:hypothetical protein